MVSSFDIKLYIPNPSDIGDVITNLINIHHASAYKDETMSAYRRSSSNILAWYKNNGALLRGTHIFAHVINYSDFKHFDTDVYAVSDMLSQTITMHVVSFPK